MNCCTILAVAICAMAMVASAASIDGSVKFVYMNPALKAPAAAPLDAMVILDAGRRSAFIRKDGGFSFTDVAPGQYTVDVSATGFQFEPTSIIVSEKGAVTAFRQHALSATDPTPVRTPAAYPLQLRPAAPETYFVPRESIDVLAWLKQPMVLMMVLMGGMALLMPRLMGNMTPEEKAEMRRMQSQMSISNLLSGNKPQVEAKPKTPRAPAVKAE